MMKLSWKCPIAVNCCNHRSSNVGGLTVWWSWIEWRCLFLRNLLDLTKQLAGRRLVEANLSAESDRSDGIKQAQSTDCVYVCCVLAEVKWHLSISSLHTTSCRVTMTIIIIIIQSIVYFSFNNCHLAIGLPASSVPLINPFTLTLMLRAESECPDAKNYKWRLNPVWHRMLYSCTHMATVASKG